MESGLVGTGGRIIRRARLRAGLSQREVAERLDTSQSLVARWEGGRVAPSLDTVIRAVRACGLDLDLHIDSYDYEHDAHISENLRLSPAERLHRMLEGVKAVEKLKQKATVRD
jgi:hypothetical protein